MNVVYGCHVDLGPDDKPDGCVLDYDRPEDCVHAPALVMANKGREACQHWKPINISVPGDSYAALAASHQRLKEALQRVVASRDERAFEREQFFPARVDKALGDIPAYWSPAASMVDSEAIAAAREALRSAP